MPGFVTRVAGRSLADGEWGSAFLWARGAAPVECPVTKEPAVMGVYDSHSLSSFSLIVLRTTAIALIYRVAPACGCVVLTGASLSSRRGNGFERC